MALWLSVAFQTLTLTLISSSCVPLTELELTIARDGRFRAVDQCG